MTSNKLPDTLAPVAASSRRPFLFWLGLASLLGILFLAYWPGRGDAPAIDALSDGPAGSDGVGTSIGSGADTASLDGDTARQGQEDLDPGAIGNVTDGGAVLSPAGVAQDLTSGERAAEVADDAASRAGSADDRSLDRLLGDRPVLIAMYPDTFVVTADGRRFAPGDELAAGVVLDAIDADALHFSQEGRSFSVAAFTSASSPAPVIRAAPSHETKPD